MSKRRNSMQEASMPMTGISALLVIFAVLCLTVFAVLSVSTVKTDQSLADRAVQQTISWYEADGQAEIILAALRQGEVPEGVSLTGTDDQGRKIYEYTCPLSDTQSLQVRAAVRGQEYKILRWQLVSTTDWQADEDLNVWDGE